jgi:hypothetical protein
MFSRLRNDVIYTDISPDIIETDVDVDADMWTYNEREVYRGNRDARYTSLDVYWLYDENLKRVGLAEHEPSHPEVMETLWFHENPYATLFQEDDWVNTETTIWSKLSPEAYQDCMEDDIRTLAKKALPKYSFVTPDWFTNGQQQKIANRDSVIFLDESFVIYTAPNDSTVWSKLGLLHDAYVQPSLLEPPPQPELEQAPLPVTEIPPSEQELPPPRPDSPRP